MTNIGRAPSPTRRTKIVMSKVMIEFQTKEPRKKIPMITILAKTKGTIENKLFKCR